MCMQQKGGGEVGRRQQPAWSASGRQYAERIAGRRIGTNQAGSTEEPERNIKGAEGS